MERQYLQEAFHAMELLEEEAFGVDDAGIKDILDFQDHDELNDMVDVTDGDADSEEDVKDTYIGDVILECTVCHSPIFKAVEDVEIDEEDGELANIDDECPICHSNDGFKIIGQVCPFEEDPELKVEVEDKDDEEDEDEEDDEEVSESLNEGLLGKVAGSTVGGAIGGAVAGPLGKIAGNVVGGAVGKNLGEECEECENDYSECDDEMDDSFKEAFGCEDCGNEEELEEGVLGAVAGGIAANKMAKEAGAKGLGKAAATVAGAALGSKLQNQAKKALTPNPLNHKKQEKQVKNLAKTAALGAAAVGLYKDKTDDGKVNLSPVKNLIGKNESLEEDFLREGFEKVDLEMEDKIIHVSEEEKEPIPDAEMITPVSDELENELTNPEDLDDEPEDEAPVVDVPEEDMAPEEEAGAEEMPEEGEEDLMGEEEPVEEPEDEEEFDGQESLKEGWYISSNVDGEIAKVHSEAEAKRTIAQFESDDKNDPERCKQHIVYSISDDGKGDEASETFYGNIGAIEKEDDLTPDPEFNDYDDDYVDEDEVDEGLLGTVAGGLAGKAIGGALGGGIAGKALGAVGGAVAGNMLQNKLKQNQQQPLNNSLEEDKDMVDYNVDEVDEKEMDSLGEAYLKNVYENVNAFNTSSVSIDAQDRLVVEGVITFNSGKTKATQFIFEAQDATKDGKVRFIGENAQITRGKKAFTLTGQMNNGKFIAESLNYNYRADSNRVYGTVKING